MLLSKGLIWGLFYKDSELISGFIIDRQIRSLVCDSVFTLVGRLLDSFEGEFRGHMIPRVWDVSPWHLADTGP